MEFSPVSILNDHGKRRGRAGRPHLPMERRAQLLASFRQSGLTRRAFAREEGVRYSTFCAWVRREGHGRAPKPLAVAPVRFAQVALPAVGARDGLEVELPDGTMLRGGRAEDLAALARALRG